MDVSREHIEIVEGARGPKARILGHRIRVVDVVGWYEEQGMSADEIVEEFPTITKADVYAALAYYWDNKEELDRKIAADEAYVQELMKKEPGRLPARMAVAATGRRASISARYSSGRSTRPVGALG